MVPSSQMSLSCSIPQRGRSWETQQGCQGTTAVGLSFEMLKRAAYVKNHRSEGKVRVRGGRDQPTKPQPTSSELTASGEELSQPFSTCDAKNAHRELPPAKAQQQQSHLPIGSILRLPIARHCPSSTSPGQKRGEKVVGASTGEGGAITGTSGDGGGDADSGTEPRGKALAGSLGISLPHLF